MYIIIFTNNPLNFRGVNKYNGFFDNYPRIIYGNSNKNNIFDGL